MAKKNFRILSLDGGGSWALIQIEALKVLFGGGATKGTEVLRNFDLVVSNSGGSIVLGTLLADMTLQAAGDLFATKADTIFVSESFLKDPTAALLRTVGVKIGPQYSTEAKLQGLQTALGVYGGLAVTAAGGLIGDNYRGRTVNIAICGFDYDANRETFFRSDTDSLAASGTVPVDATIAEAIHASSTAPVNYFDKPAKFSGRRFWDGAVGGYNNPVFAGVIEATANAARYGIAGNAIAALSIGSGSVALLRKDAPGAPDPKFIAPHVQSSIPDDVIKMAESILDDPPDAASFHTHVMLGGGLTVPVTDGPIVRMNPLIQPVKSPAGAWAAPSDLTDTQFTGLVGLDFDKHGPDDIKLIQALCASWLADRSNNQPIRANAQTTEAEIGHGKFSQALAAWNTLQNA